MHWPASLSSANDVMRPRAGGSRSCDVAGACNAHGQPCASDSPDHVWCVALITCCACTCAPWVRVAGTSGSRRRGAAQLCPHPRPPSAQRTPPGGAGWVGEGVGAGVGRLLRGTMGLAWAPRVRAHWLPGVGCGVVRPSAAWTRRPPGFFQSHHPHDGNRHVAPPEARPCAAEPPHTHTCARARAWRVRGACVSATRPSPGLPQGTAHASAVGGWLGQVPRPAAGV